jgi:hypothetical protein
MVRRPYSIAPLRDWPDVALILQSGIIYASSVS